MNFFHCFVEMADIHILLGEYNEMQKPFTMALLRH